MLKTILLSLFLVVSHHFETVTPTPSPTINQAPQLKGYEIVTQIATENELFEFYVPVEDIFYDNGELTYSASESKKETLPIWLAFNDESYSFFGFPSDTDIGRYNISLTATDQGGLESSTYFLIEIMGQSENKDTLSSGGITGIILGLLAAISPCIVDGIAYARWRIKKKTEEDDPSSLLTCENYRSECCKGKFKFLNCYNKCDGCCSSVFSCVCDDCCKACCKEDSCNCCVSSYHQPSGNDEKSLETHHTNNEQNLTVGGNITASSGGAVNIDNSNKSNNSTQNTHVKNKPSYNHPIGNDEKEPKTHHTNNEQTLKISGNVTASNGGVVNIHNSNKINNSTHNTHVKNDHRSQVTNHYHHNVQVVKEEKNTTSNQRSEYEKLKIEIETLSNQLNKEVNKKDNQLNIKSQELKEKDEQITTLQAQEKQITNELNNKSQLIENLSNQLKGKDTKLNEKSQQLNELKLTLKEKDENYQQELKKKDKQLNEKDEQIITLQAQEKQITNELNNKSQLIENLSNQLKGKDTKLNEKSQQLNELKLTLKEKDENYQQELKKKLKEIQVIENKFNKKKKRIKTLSNQLNKKDEQLEEKDEKINMLNKEVNKKDNQLNIKSQQLKEKDEQITTLQAQEKQHNYIKGSLIFSACAHVTHASSYISNSVAKIKNVQNADYAYKVNLIGEESVGKTCIYTRLEKGTFSEQYKATSVPASMNLCYNVKLDNKNIALNIFDTGGQERYSRATKNAYRGVQCLILCYDLTQKKTYDSCKERWKKEIENIVQGKPLLILCGTKSDLVDRRIITPKDIRKLENYFKESDLAKGVLSIEVSAKDNRSIEDLMKFAAFYLASYEPKKYGNIELKVGDKVTFTQHSGYQGKKGVVVETYQDVFKVKILDEGGNSLILSKKRFNYIKELQT